MKKTFKRIFASLMVAVMVLTAAPLSGFAGLDLQSIFGVSASAAEYSGTCGDNLTWTFDDETGELVISGTGEMNAIYNLLDYQEFIKTVVIENGVTSIADFFGGCDNLVSISIPASVTDIPVTPFWGCNTIENITVDPLNPSYSSDEFGVLFNKDKTTLIQYPVGNKRTYYEIPTGVNMIAQGAFYFEPILSEDEKIIGVSTLTDVKIPDTVKTIDLAAFACSGLTTVKIPASVTSIGIAAFSACLNLTKIIVDPENTKYASDEEGVLFDIGKTELMQYPCGSECSDYTIPDTVSVISYAAFGFNENLNNVKISDSVVEIYDAAFAYTGITSVYIPESVRIIESNAFSRCENLEEVTFSSEENDYLGISRSVFSNCKKIKSISLPDSVGYIHENTFSGCQSLESVKLGKNVTNMELAFQNCEKLTEITLYNKIGIIYESFQGCDNLTDVYYYGTEEEWNEIRFLGNNEPLLNATIHFLGDYGFTYELDENNEATITGYNGEVPSELEIPSTIDGYKVVAIGLGAFTECDEIVTVTIPDSVTHIASSIAFSPFKSVTLGGAFSLCRNLTKFIVDENNPKYSNDENGVLFNKDKTVLYQYPSGNKNEKYSIDDSVKLIYSGALSGCAYLKSIEVDEDNNSYSTNEEGVLFNKDKTTLICYPAGKTEKSYSVPDTVNKIGACAFVLSNIISVDIGNSVTAIEAFALLACMKLATVSIGNNVTDIGIASFASCSALKTLTIGDGLSQVNLERIDALAFIECNELLDVYFHGTEDEWNEIEILAENKPLLNATIHFLGEQGFTYELDENDDAIITGYNGEVPSELEIPSAIDGYTVIAIGDSAFENCANLISVTIPDSVTSIGDDAFSGCENLTDLPMGKNVTSIGVRTFAGCKGLIDVTIPDGVVTIGMYAFMMCDGLENVTIPASVKEIGWAPFLTCVNLEHITVDEANTEYSSKDNVLFNKDQSVLIQYPYGAMGSRYIVPDTVKIVEASSFFMFSLEKVTLPYVTHINEAAFAICENLAEVTIGNSLEFVDEGAFADCISLTDVYYYGTEEEWNEIEIEEGNECLLNATIHFLGEHNLTHFTIPSTCKVQGMEYDLCSDCGETFNVKVLPLADHTWGKWEVVREATTALEGLKQRKCSVCGTTEDELIPKLKVLVDDESGIIIEYEDEYGEGVEIVVEETYDGNSFQLIGLNYGNNQTKIFDISTVKDGEKVQPDGKVKVKIPLPEGFGTKNIFVCYVDSTNGTVKNIPVKVVNGYVEFEAEHFSYYAIVEKLGKVNSVSINDISMSYKDSATITPSVNVDPDVKYTVSYSSSNDSVATVDANGNVTTRGTGSATINVTVTDQYGNTVTDTCNVNVSYKWWQWIIVIVLFGWIWY